MEPLWAVCFYLEGGPNDGTYIIEFVRCADRDLAVGEAEGLNEHMAPSLALLAAARYEENS